MKTKRIISAVVLAVFAATASTATVQAMPFSGFARQSLQQVKRIREGGSVMAPFAMIQFCVRSPGDCRRSDGHASIAWSLAVWQLIARTNTHVNRTIRPVHDAAGADVWSVGVVRGDCEDFALTKRRTLMRAGLPASALRMAVATTPSGEGHAVLVVTTSRGDFVLDNRTDLIVSWRSTDLDWIKIASAQDPRLWRRVI